MYELVIIACLLAEPQHCEEFHQPFVQPTGMMACLREGQFELVRWAEDMTDWSVRRWRCGLPGA